MAWAPNEGVFTSHVSAAAVCPASAASPVAINSRLNLNFIGVAPDYRVSA